MGVDFVLLTDGTSVDEVFYERREIGPSKVIFKDRLGVEDTHMTSSGGRVDEVEKRGAG